MTEPPKLKRKVTGQITISSPSLATPNTFSTPTTPSHLPRARAKVDVSALPAASGSRPGLPHASSSTGRPTLRSTPSSASLRSNTSAGSRARSPAPPPLPSPSIKGRSQSATTTTPNANGRPAFRPSTSQTSTPVVRRPTSSGRNSPVKETPTARVRASAVTQNAFAGRSPVGGFKSPEMENGQGGGGFFRRPSEPETAKVRARVTPTQSVHVPRASAPAQVQASISTSPQRYGALLSPDPGLEQQIWYTPTTSSPKRTHTSPPPMVARTESEHPVSRPSVPRQASPSTVISPSFAQHALMGQIPQHPTASAPGSPRHSSTPLGLRRSSSIQTRTKRGLPFNPAIHAPALPSTPLSPEIRTIDLPMMTPTRSREDPPRRPSLPSRVSGTVEHGLDFDTEGTGIQGLSMTSEDESSGALLNRSVNSTEPQDISEVDILLEDEDVVEAKINRKIADLEITNASLLAINRSLEATKSKQRSEILKLRRMLRESLSGPLGGLPGLPTPLPAYLTSPNPDERDQDSDEEDLRDPELDARWDKIADMVETMKKKAATAVERGKEEVKMGAGRVLDWTEVEGLDSSIGSMAGTPEPERITEE